MYPEHHLVDGNPVKKTPVIIHSRVMIRPVDFSGSATLLQRKGVTHKKGMKIIAEHSPSRNTETERCPDTVIPLTEPTSRPV
jgi:hypothetical protein